MLVTDEAGNTVWTSEYTPFGQITMEEGTLTKAAKFTGKDLDEDTGLYYFNARWYDSEIGRFISEDPAADPNNPNLYTYCRNNPLKFIDSSGLLSYESNEEEEYNWYIEEGDTLTDIGKQLGFTVEEILDVNPDITDPDLIVAGKNMNIPQNERIMALQWAIEQIGSTEYAYTEEKGNYEANSWKCTLFVADAYVEGAGVTDYPTQRSWFGLGPERYAITKQLTSEETQIGGLKRLTEPLPGVIAAFPNDPYLGHAMIVGLKGELIGAGEFTVNVRSFDYMFDHGYEDPVYWGY